MEGFSIPTTCGRRVLIRPCVDGRAVQVAIISTYGNIMEAVTLDATQLPGFIGGLEEAGGRAAASLERALAEATERSEASLLDRLAEAEAAARATHCPEGHKLTKANSFQKAPGVKGCRRCRREANTWRRKERGLS